LNWELQDWNDTANFDPAIDGFLVEFRVAAAQRYFGLATLDDINGNGRPELAALRTLLDGTPEIVIKDSDTKQLISELPLPQATDGVATGLTGLLDINGNSTPEVAVLMVLPSGQGLVKIKDRETGTWIGQIRFFGSEWQAKAITSQDLDLDGVSEISVLAVRKDGTRSAIQIKDSLSGEPVNWIELPVD
jgi:hypothetical protein